MEEHKMGTSAYDLRHTFFNRLTRKSKHFSMSDEIQQR